HRGLCYESSDTSVATVDKNGYITMVSKGTCDIWVYAQNGCYSTIKLLVK
ncbi:MAG: Ig-like domain-containing protein, partial [Lachnospiraceae bacterium]|nr:Ig-like domain-containing protein [Lachnospiraceae bacterium]